MTSASVKSSCSGGNILVVDDEASLCKFMEITLGKEGYQVTATQSPKKALQTLKGGRYDLVIADLMMPEMSGLELLKETKQINRDQDFIVMTAFGSMESAIAAMKLGATDYITKPFNIDQIKFAIDKAFERRRPNAEPVPEAGKPFGGILGVSPAISRALAMAERISHSESTALILGESGVGKDLMARAIHAASPRGCGPFVTINCAALPESLLESELFGHKKGSFTGAIRDKEGLFQVASGGTLFLDEIGNVSLGIQAKLLRVIEDHIVTPVGETKPSEVDVRLIAATNADLEGEVKAGRFRHDLYYRLNVISLVIPPLRERREDIPMLAEYFLGRAAERLRAEPKRLAPSALERLLAYDWPGNIRELENSLERAVVFAKSSVIGPEEFADKLTGPLSPTAQQVVTEAEPASPTLASIERAYIFYVMNQSAGNKTKAAKLLGIDASTLYRKLERYGLDTKDSAVKS